MICTILDDVFPEADGELSIALLDAEEMTRINTAYLGHDESTDVITFNYSDKALSGEIMVCIDEAIWQAHSFGTVWESELVRYIIHGVLHLKGYEDHTAILRKRVQREEDRILRGLMQKYDLTNLVRHTVKAS
jgi:probable rRNA maturation factor